LIVEIFTKVDTLISGAITEVDAVRVDTTRSDGITTGGVGGG
jgi:hypothetical protein